MAEDTKKRAFTIHLFSSGADVRERMSAALSAMSHYLVTAHDLAALLDGRTSFAGADIVILDVGDGAVLDSGEIYAARKRFARVPLLVICEQVEPERVRAIMRLDASDLLEQPVDSRKLVEAVELQLGSNSMVASHVMAVVSAVGGGGSSSLAVTIAQTLTEKGTASSHDTCIVDLDFASASCGYYLDAVSDYDLSATLEQPTRLDAEFMDIIRKETPAGFSVFSFDQKSLPLHPNACDLVLRMLDILSYQYKKVVIDLPYWEAGWKMPVLEAVNDVLIVSNFTIPALKHARDLYGRVTKARNSRAGITLIVNRYRRRLFSNTLSKAELKKIFKDRPVGFIREDYETLSEAANRGVLPLEVNSRSHFVRDTRDLLAEHRRRNNEEFAA